MTNSQKGFYISLAILFVLNGLQAIVPFMSGTVALIANALLSVLAGMSHTSAIASAKMQG